jgi:alpha-galactosidase
LVACTGASLLCEQSLALTAIFILTFGSSILKALKLVWLIWLAVYLPAIAADAKVKTDKNEMCKRDRWINSHLIQSEQHPVITDSSLPRSHRLPFSFVFAGRSSDDLLARWPRQFDRRNLDDLRTQYTFSWRDPKSGLIVRCVVVVYADYPVVEWTCYFINAGTRATPVLQQVQAVDMSLRCQAKHDFVLHYIKGDSNSPDSFQPRQEKLDPHFNKTFAPVGGQSTNGAFPYYHIDMQGEGVLLALGWPGQWSCRFIRDEQRGLRITAGQELLHLYLEPGEQIRTPLAVLLFRHGGDQVRGQNLWRRWMLRHNTPRPDGHTPEPIYAFCSGGYFPELRVSEASEKQFIDTLTTHGVKLDYWWMDAGWYPCTRWSETGTWEPDSERFPHGLKAISDYVHDRGAGLIVWFEPERVTKGSFLAQHHPEWLLGETLLNLGNPQARMWLTNHVDRMLTEQGIDLYRQDFNMQPLKYWRNNDAPDRQGITENLHVQGLLSYWDELLRRHPDMLIDNCSSGGRRNDLELLRRALPLLRSDYQSFQGAAEFAAGNQGHTYGLSQWIPYYGTGVYATTQNFTYYVRSHMCPAFCIVTDVRKPGTDWNLYRKLVEQWRRTAATMLGDYYPLTPYSLDEKNWVAWQFDDPERNSGLVQAFRRRASDVSVMIFPLQGLDVKSSYYLTDVDSGRTRILSGKELMKHGLTITINEQPGSALITFAKVQKNDSRIR